MNSKYIYTPYIKQLSQIDELDTEKFILEVQKRECIWNVNSKSYNLKCIRNRETKKRAWEEIGRIFYPDWDNLTVEDRQKKVDSLSKKWANIRKYYTDEVRRTADNPPKKRQRRYHHLLTFLDDAVNKKRVPRINEFKNIAKQEVGIDSSSDSEFGVLYIVEDTDESKQLTPKCENATITPALLDKKDNNPHIYLNDKPESNDDFDLWENKTTITKTYAKSKPLANQNQTTNSAMVKKNPEIIKLLNEPQGPPSINDHFLHFPVTIPVDSSMLSKHTDTLDQTAEASKRFLLSLLPEVMSLDVRQNLQFRLGILDLLNDIKSKANPNINPNIFPCINID